MYFLFSEDSANAHFPRNQLHRIHRWFAPIIKLTYSLISHWFSRQIHPMMRWHFSTRCTLFLNCHSTRKVEQFDYSTLYYMVTKAFYLIPFEIWSTKRKSTSIGHEIISHHPCRRLINPTIHQQLLLLNLKCNRNWMQTHKVNPQVNGIRSSLIKRRKQDLRMMLLFWIQMDPLMQMSELRLPNLLIWFSLRFLACRHCDNMENMSMSPNYYSQSQSKKNRGEKRKNSNRNEEDEMMVNDGRKKRDQRSILNPPPLPGQTNPI